MKRVRELLAFPQEETRATECAIQEVPREMFHEILRHLDAYPMWVMSTVSFHCRGAVLSYIDAQKTRRSTFQWMMYTHHHWFEFMPDWPVRAACASYSMNEVIFASRACHKKLVREHAHVAARNANMPVLEALCFFKVAKWTPTIVEDLVKTGNMNIIKKAIHDHKAPYHKDLPLSAFYSPLEDVEDVTALLHYLNGLPNTRSIAESWSHAASENMSLGDTKLKALFAIMMEIYGTYMVEERCLRNLILNHMFETAADVAKACQHLSLTKTEFLEDACELDNVEAIEWLMARGCVPNEHTFAVATLASNGNALRVLHKACPVMPLTRSYYTALAYGNKTTMQVLYDLGCRVSDCTDLQDALRHVAKADSGAILSVRQLLEQHGVTIAPEVTAKRRRPNTDTGFFYMSPDEEWASSSDEDDDDEIEEDESTGDSFIASDNNSSDSSSSDSENSSDSDSDS